MSTARPSAPVTREERREVYEAVLRTLDAQTSPKQRPGVRRTTLTRILSPPSGTYDLDAVENAIRAARDHGDILTWPDHDGRPRYTQARVDKLRRLAMWEANREHYRTEIIAWANQMVQEVGEGD